MKKILSFLLVIIGLLGYSQDEYYRKVDWKFYPENVVQLTDSTYLTDAIPFDYNDPASIRRVIGNYVVDYVGHRYSVIDSTSTTITVLDIYHIGQAPQTGQIARCYRSVGDGEAEYIGSIDYSPLDESSRWKLNGSDNELLWRQTIGKAENGLYKDFRTVKLGGDLIEPTTIDQDDNSLKILNNGHGSVFSETGIAYTKIDTVDFTDSTLVTKMYVKSLIKEGTSHDSLTIAAGSTDYFEVNYPQIFSGQKLIDSLGVMNTKISGKEPLLTKGNLTAGSSKVNIGGTGTGAVIGAGASIDVNEANIVHQNLSGHGTNTHAQIDTHITNDADLSTSNELNTSVVFNKTNNKIEITDSGGTKSDTIEINQDLLINGYSGTINVITNPVAFSWPVSYSDTNYYLDIFAHYTETIDGKNVLIRNAVYDFVKTTNGFSLKLDTLAGVVEYRASRTINSETPANVLLQSDLTTTVGTPGLDTKIPTEKAVRTALSGVAVTETDPVYSAKFDLTGSANGDLLKYNGTKYIKFTPNYLTSFTELDPVYSASSWFGTTNNSTNWNTSYTDRLKWDGGSTGLTAATGRTSLGGTTIGQAMFTSTNPGAVVFGRANADNTFSWLNAADFKTAIGITTAATSLDLTTSLSANQSYQGVTESGVVGENVAFGDVLYLKFSDGKWWKAKADAYITTPAMRMALATITANNTGTILIEGNVRYDSWSFAANKVYLSAATAGAITTTQPATTGNQIQVVGVAKTSTKMYFKPSQDVGEK